MFKLSNKNFNVCQTINLIEQILKIAPYLNGTKFQQSRSEVTGRIQCEVLTALPILSSFFSEFLGQPSKI